ncbi:Glycosyl transferase family 90 [Fragilaria crotonensis]|nr:Glycosyl transferase family 90 [Fragilaria crotonensis]
MVTARRRRTSLCRSLPTANSNRNAAQPTIMKLALLFRKLFLWGALFVVFDLFVLPILHSNMKMDNKLDHTIQLPNRRNGTDSSTMSYVTTGTQPETTVPPYTQHDILRLYQHHQNKKTSVLIFDGWEFKMYDFHPSQDGFLCRDRLSELLMDGLLTSRPDRFAKAMPPFQLTIAGCQAFMDYTYYPCAIDHQMGCSNYSFPPVVTAVSIPKNPLVTFIHQLPSEPFGSCMHMWRHRHIWRRNSGTCAIRRELKQFKSTTEVWKRLKPQLYYRGADFKFFWYGEGFDHLKACGHVLPPDITNLTIGQVADILLQEPHLQPRCRIVALSLKGESLVAQNKSFEDDMFHTFSWIDARFHIDGGMHLHQSTSHAKLLKTKSTPSLEMAMYKYQIDLGGIGGTSWTGTITKLAMPGLLFHHETPAKDWFYDEIQPWVHYVPVDLTLSNLYDMYVWAETHPIEAKKIAKQGQEFARNMASNAYWKTTFQKLYVQGLGRIVDAYQPSPNETLSSILEGYRDGGFELSLTGVYPHY